MKLSRFYSTIELQSDIYAIFNSLLMNILYVDKTKQEHILKFDISIEEKKNY